MKAGFIPYYILLACVFFVSCKTKYDTSKGVEVISTENIVPDYRLSNIGVEIADVSVVVETPNGDVQEHTKIQKGKFAYYNEKAYIAEDDTFKIHDLATGSTRGISHSIVNPQIYVSDTILLLYNFNGNFAFFDTQTFEQIWNDDAEIQELASKFVCFEDSCYALTLQGEILTLNYQEMSKNRVKYFQNQEMILSDLYTPTIVDGKVIFAVGDSEFAIFDTYQKKIIDKSSFAGEDSTVFDINIVRNIYSNSKNFIISYLNGTYAYSMFYARPIWQKNFIFTNALITENLLFFYDEKSTKLVCLHIESGEVKWIQDVKYYPKFFNLDFNKNLIITEKNGIHIIDIETGGEISFKNVKIDAEQSFVFNSKLHYKLGSKIFQIQ